MPGPPEGAVFCLLCRGTVLILDGNTEKYIKHLTNEHGVFYNREWLVEWTIRSQLKENKEELDSEKLEEKNTNDKKNRGAKRRK